MEALPQTLCGSPSLTPPSLLPVVPSSSPPSSACCPLPSSFIRFLPPSLPPPRSWSRINLVSETNGDPRCLLFPSSPGHLSPLLTWNSLFSLSLSASLAATGHPARPCRSPSSGNPPLCISLFPVLSSPTLATPPQASPPPPPSGRKPRARTPPCPPYAPLSRTPELLPGRTRSPSASTTSLRPPQHRQHPGTGRRVFPALSFCRARGPALNAPALHRETSSAGSPSSNTPHHRAPVPAVPAPEAPADPAPCAPGLHVAIPPRSSCTSHSRVVSRFVAPPPVVPDFGRGRPGLTPLPAPHRAERAVELPRHPTSSCYSGAPPGGLHSRVDAAGRSLPVVPPLFESRLRRPQSDSAVPSRPRREAATGDQSLWPLVVLFILGQRYPVQLYFDMETEETKDYLKNVDWKTLGNNVTNDTGPGAKKRLPKKLRQVPDYYFLPRRSLSSALALSALVCAAGVGAGMLVEVWINKKIQEDGGVIWELDKK